MSPSSIRCRGEPSSGYAPDPFLEGTLSAWPSTAARAGSKRGRTRPPPTPRGRCGRALEAAGVHIARRRAARAPRRRRDPARAGARRPPLAQLLGLMLPPSDNFFAETLVKDLGARFAGAGHHAARARGVSATRSPRCSASTRASSTARGSPSRPAPRPTRSPTCSSRSADTPTGRGAARKHGGRRAHRHARAAACATPPRPGAARGRPAPSPACRTSPATAGRKRPHARLRDLHRRHRNDPAHVFQDHIAITARRAY